MPQQKAFPEVERQGQWRLVASPEGEQGSLKIHQDARICLSLLEGDEDLNHTLAAGRHAWLQVLRGRVRLQDIPLAAGDGVRISNEAGVSITALEPAELLLFDLP